MKSPTDYRKMKTTVAFLLALSFAPLASRAQTNTNTAPVPVAPRQFQEQLMKLPPEERAAKFKEFREKRQQELMKLPPEERRAKLGEWRQQRAKAAPPESQITEQRRAKLKERLEALRAKQTEGKLSEQDEKLLERLERANKLMEEHPLPPKPAVKPADPPTAKPAEKTEPAKN